MGHALRWLLDTSMGPPGPAGDWPAWLSVAFHASNFVIFAGYMSVPLIILSVWKYHRDGISGVRLWLVLAFLPAQALSRLARVLELWGTPYRLTTLLDCVAAVTVVVAVVHLRPKILHVMRLPSREQMHDVIGQLNLRVLKEQVLRQELQTQYDELRERQRTRRDPDEEAWSARTRERLDRMLEVLDDGA